MSQPPDFVLQEMSDSDDIDLSTYMRPPVHYTQRPRPRRPLASSVVTDQEPSTRTREPKSAKSPTSYEDWAARNKSVRQTDTNLNEPDHRSKPKAVPFKVQKSREMADALSAAGVSQALEQLSARKRQKQQQKKAKRRQIQSDSESTDDNEDSKIEEQKVVELEHADFDELADMEELGDDLQLELIESLTSDSPESALEHFCDQHSAQRSFLGIAPQSKIPTLQMGQSIVASPSNVPLLSFVELTRSLRVDLEHNSSSMVPAWLLECFFPSFSAASTLSLPAQPAPSLLVPLLKTLPRPSPVQSITLPLLLRGVGPVSARQSPSMVAIAPTGSGKTLAFLLPAFVLCWQRQVLHLAQHMDTTAISASDLLSPPGTFNSAAPSTSTSNLVMVNPSRINRSVGRPHVVILAPTRELCVQIACVATQSSAIARLNRRVCQSLSFAPPAQRAGICVISLFGGPDISKQQQLLNQPVDIIVATPGRLLQLADLGSVQLNETSMLILDEADRLLDAQFSEETLSIARLLPERSTPQLLLFSATWPAYVQSAAAELLELRFTKRPAVFVSIGAKVDEEQTSVAASSSALVKQIVTVIDRKGFVSCRSVYSHLPF